MDIRIKRIYEPRASTDGYRILVDRVWPRGLSKQKAALDQWLKEIAPSKELRQWFKHDPARWPEFRRRYRKELAGKQEIIEDLRSRAAEGTVTLLYSARDPDRNQAVVLKEYLEEME